MNQFQSKAKAKRKFKKIAQRNLIQLLFKKEEVI